MTGKSAKIVRITIFVLAILAVFLFLIDRFGFAQPPEPPADKPAEETAGVLPNRTPPAFWLIEAVEGAAGAIPKECTIEVHTAITFPAKIQGKEVRFTQVTIGIKLPGQIQGIIRQNDREVKCLSDKTEWLVDWSQFVLRHPEQGGPFPHASQFSVDKQTGFWLATQVILESSQPVALAGGKARIVFSLM